MTTTTVPGRPRPGSPGAGDGPVTRLRGMLVDGSAAALRVLTKLRHDPQAIVLTLASPVLLVLIFGYIFGSAISAPGHGDYREYLVAGLFASVAGNILPPMVQLARDHGRGAVDRFRSLPIARSAVPFGQAAASALYGLLALVLMAGCGLIVGWRVRHGALDALAALALLVAFQFAMTWVGMFLGLVLGSEEAAGQASILVLPVTMLSNIFVPTTGMPAWLRLIADWNPISAVAAAVRGLFGNPNAPTDGAWPLEHPVPATLAWTVVLLLVFVPLCTRRFTRPD